MIRFLLVVSSVLWTGLVLGDTSLGEVADNLQAPVSVVFMLIEWACYVVGVALIIGAAMQYRIHRQNPKLTPLFTPVMMLLVGITIVLIPHFSMLPEESWSPKLPANKVASPNAAMPSQNDNGGGGHWGSDPRYGQ